MTHVTTRSLLVLGAAALFAANAYAHHSFAATDEKFDR